MCDNWNCQVNIASSGTKIIVFQAVYRQLSCAWINSGQDGLFQNKSASIKWKISFSIIWFEIRQAHVQHIQAILSCNVFFVPRQSILHSSQVKCTPQRFIIWKLRPHPHLSGYSWNRVFPLHFQKNMRPHVAYSNQFCTSIWKHLTLAIRYHPSKSMRYASSKMTSSFQKTSIFVRPNVNKKLAFSNIFTLESSFEKVHFWWPNMCGR